METFKIGICEPSDFSKKAVDMLEKVGEVHLFTGGELSDFIADKNAIFVRLGYSIDEDLLKNAAYLKYICSPTTGLNHIKVSKDLYSIVSLKGEYEFLDSIRATPEHVFGLTIALLRNYAHAFLNSSNPIFDRNPYKGYEIFDNEIGIIGFGRVGKIIANYYNTFGAHVYYYDSVEKESDIATKCNSIDEVIKNSNIVVLATNYTPENEKMISEKQFEMLKGKFFINAARGELVDEDKLIEYIQKDWFKGIAIDVIANETDTSEFYEKLLNCVSKTNLIITPHIGGATFSSMERTEEFIAKKLIDMLKNDKAVRCHYVNNKQ